MVKEVKEKRKPEFLNIKDVVKSMITGTTDIVVEEYINGMYVNVIRGWQPNIDDLKHTCSVEKIAIVNLTKKTNAIDDLIKELEKNDN